MDETKRNRWMPLTDGTWQYLKIKAIQKGFQTPAEMLEAEHQAHKELTSKRK